MQNPVTHSIASVAYQALPHSPCLLIEGEVPVRFDIELGLRKRFNAAIRRIFVQSQQAIVMPDRWWEDYDLVLLSGVDLSQIEWGFNSVNPQAHKPSIIALTKQDQHGFPAPAIFPIDRYLPDHTSASIFAQHLDEVLEVRHLLNQYPWLRANESLSVPLELLHRSEGAVLFRQVGNQVVKHFKLDTRLLAQHHFERFLSLVEKLQALNHPNIVPIVDVHASSKGLYIVMDYVQGDTLKGWLWDEPLPPLERRLAWFKGIVTAVDVLHQAGIVHGDLKASNIMVRADDQPVLLDFGLDGQLLREAGSLSEGEIYGTPYYVSPELIMGDPLDYQADIYALGILFYELLTGHKPYQGGSLELILRQHMLAPIPTLPPELERYQVLLKWLMAKIPESRIPSASQLLTELKQLSLQP